MPANRRLAKRTNIFYGWWIVASGFIGMALSGGVYFYGSGAFITPLMKEFGWSSTALSLAFSLSRLEGGIAGPVMGFLIDRFGPRRLMIAGCVIAGFGYFLFAQVNSLEVFYFVFIGMVSLGASLGLQAPASAAVANWFVKRRSLALGIMMCGVAFGGAAVPGVAWLISQYGWRNTSIWIGILFLVVGVPLALVMRQRPEPYGYLPDGEDPQTRRVQVAASEARKEQAAAEDGDLRAAAVEANTAETSFTPREALATSAFWMFSIIFAVRYTVTSAIGVHQIPALQSMDYSSEVAAGIVAAMTIISIPGRLGFGWLGDHFDKRYVIGACMFLQFLGLMAFTYASDYFLIAVFLVVYSPAYGGLVALIPATWAEYFGRKSFASISGLSQAVVMIGNISGPMVAGYTFDTSGSYQFAFLAFAIMNLVGLALLFFVKRPGIKLTVVQAVPSSG